jgi:hypothetical protein
MSEHLHYEYTVFVMQMHFYIIVFSLNVSYCC